MTLLNQSFTFTHTTTFPPYYLDLYLHHPGMEDFTINSPCFTHDLSKFLGARTITAPMNASMDGIEATPPWLSLTRPTGLHWNPVGSQAFG